MRKCLIILISIIILSTSLFASIIKQKELEDNLKEYLSYRTTKKVELEFSQGFIEGNKYEAIVTFNFPSLSFTLPIVYGESNIYNSIEDSLNYALSQYLSPPSDNYIVGNIENRLYGPKSENKKGKYFYLKDCNRNNQAVIEKVAETDKYDIYDTVYSNVAYPFFKVEKAKVLTLSFAPSISFDSIGGGGFIDIITLPYLYPFSINAGASVLYNTKSNLIAVGYLGIGYSANISGFTSSKHTLAQDAQFNVLANCGFGQINGSNNLYFSSRVSYSHMVNTIFSWGIEAGYHYFYDYTAIKGKGIFTLSFPLKVFI